MEALLKGVLDIALDVLRGDDKNENKSGQESGSSADRGQSWSEVAGGRQEEDVDSWNTEKQRRNQESDQGAWGRQQQEGANQGWQKVGGQQSNNYKQSAHQQQYAAPTSQAEAEPTEDELQDLSRAADRLWNLDTNRLVPGRDYSINVGDGKRVDDRVDAADNTFFSNVDQNVFRRPTFARFYALTNNYNPDQGAKEQVTDDERQEEVAFIEELSRTAPFQYVFQYLAARRVISNSIEEFKQLFHNLWFGLFNRGGTQNSSSAFEHVFVGEVKKNGEVSGFHNWITLYSEEAKGRVDYRGFIFPKRGRDQPDAETQVLTIQFAWNGHLKQLSSTLVGVSPEFEMALYTLCFFVGEENNWVDLGPYRVNVKCYHMGEDRIGSIYPIAD
eukprot:TRINITY_DN13310_c0_g2_i1.p1 TRINITY_DN13310_c0_g2~~TRINITY_DN13310_c0_g2_i1.p1  ORF type:complete len:387 (+),score=80.03 TRINITY_DN13310_c0_g2_i1:167-1327(+)